MWHKLKPHKIPKADLDAVQKIYDLIEGRDERVELNLYITGTDEENAEHPVAAAAADAVGEDAAESDAGGAGSSV